MLFSGDSLSVPFSSVYSYCAVFRLSFCVFFKDDSLSVQKSMEGDSPMSISFSGEYLSVPFLKEISESLPFSFRAVLRKESHGILIPNIPDPQSLP